MHRENFLKKAGIFFLTACMLISSPAMVSADSLKDAKQEKENLGVDRLYLIRKEEYQKKVE